MREFRNIMRVDTRLILGLLGALAVVIQLWVWGSGDKGPIGLACVLSGGVFGGLMGTFFCSFPLKGMQGDGLLYDTLPLRRRTKILSHYLASVICVICTEIMAAVTLVIWNFMGMKAIDDLWVVVVISAGIIFSSSAIVAPVLIRFGLGAGITVAVLGGVILLVTGVILDNLTPAPEWGQVWWPYLYLALCLVFYTASLPVSIRFYERRDH
jgi:membrane protein